ncbi:MAG: redoxin domain-containing protein [Bacteroidales bacterium]
MKTFLASILLFLIAGIATGQGKPPDVKALEIGQPAPAFTLPGTDDKNYSLSDFDDYDFLVVLFTCNHCPTAQAYEDKFIAIVDKYRQEGVGFVAISPNSNTALSLAECGYSDLDDSFESMKIRARDKGYNFPYLFDGEDHNVSIAYGPQATPHAFVFDKDRKLKYRGRIDDTENPYIEPETTDLINALDALLSGNDPEVETTKTFGCSIKWPWKGEWAETLRKQWEEEAVVLEETDLEGIKEIIGNDTENLRLVNVWATWCGPCVIEFPELMKIFRMYSGREFELVTLSADKPGNIEKVQKFLEDQDAACTNYIFNSDDTYAMIEAVDKEWQGTLPYTMLIKPGGEIIFKHTGIIDPLEVRREIIDVLGRYYADNE